MVSYIRDCQKYRKILENIFGFDGLPLLKGKQTLNISNPALFTAWVVKCYFKPHKIKRRNLPTVAGIGFRKRVQSQNIATELNVKNLLNSRYIVHSAWL